MIVRAYEIGDVQAFSAQPGQSAEAIDAAAQMSEFAQGGPAFTGLRESGEVIGVAGLMVHHAGYATAWALLAKVTPHELAAITQVVRRVLAEASYKRIDMFVQPDWTQAKRWAWQLGFAQEQRMFCARPDGGDWLLFAKYRREDG